MDRKPLRLKNTSCSRKQKSKSIGGILKTKIFMKWVKSNSQNLSQKNCEKGKIKWKKYK